MTIKVVSIQPPEALPSGLVFVNEPPTTSKVSYDTKFEGDRLFMAAIRTALIYHSEKVWCVRERCGEQSFLLQEVRLLKYPEGIKKKPHIAIFIRE